MPRPRRAAAGVWVDRYFPSWLIAVLALTAGCTTPLSDPAFEEVRITGSGLACPSGSLCVQIKGPVDGTRPGTGSCELYGPGDPDDMQPLTVSGELQMTPGTTTTWETDVPDDFDLHDLNPVCEPMMEG